MRRVQIYLDDWLDDELATRAHREQRSKAALIREAAAQYLGDADATRASAERDAMDAWIGGTLDGEPGDIDEMVYGSDHSPAAEAAPVSMPPQPGRRRQAP